MNFRFNEEQQMMRKMVRDFAQKEIAPFVPSMEQGVFPHIHQLKDLDYS
ncbi:acyl-CoA dehydrogenase family protein [Bacillus pacificus]